MNNITKFIRQPRLIINYVLYHTAALWPDKMYLSLKFYSRFGYWIDWKHPQTFNEKLNWLKLNNRKPSLTRMADKYEVKEIVKQLIGEEYVVPCYGVWDRFEDIDFDALPQQFVLKTTGDSSGTFVCSDKTKLDMAKAKEHVMKGLERNYYYKCREWVYKDIKPRIIADQLLDDGSGHELTDYKFWCFNGEPRVMYCTNKAKNIFENFYDMDFRPMMIDHGFKRHQPEFSKPAEFELMKQLAAKLSKDLPFVRVDFFDVNGHVWFGEFTFYDWAGLNPFGGDWDYKLGEWLKLPIDNKK